MNHIFDLSTLNWTLSGWHPYLWQLSKSMEFGEPQHPEINEIPVKVPGSVQLALKNAGIIPDWNYGLNARHCEWVENRHWIFRTELPDDIREELPYELLCEGLDYSGWIVIDDKIIAEFRGADRDYVIPLHFARGGKKHSLEFIFDTPPRFLG